MSSLLYEALVKSRFRSVFVDKNNLVLFVGDLHGDPTSLELAKEVIGQGGTVVFLGDYLDRGLYQREVLEGILELYLEGAVLLRGNHEEGPPGHPRSWSVAGQDYVYHLGPEEVRLYRELHLRLPLVYYNPSQKLVGVHGLLSASLVRALPNFDMEKEMLALWSDTDPLSTEMRGIPVDDPWDWRGENVSHALAERGLLLFRGHSPHELGRRLPRIYTLFAHCFDTGGYYRYGVRYALWDGDLFLSEVIPCGTHREALQRLKMILR